MRKTELPADWSVYMSPEVWPYSKGRVFMAQAVMRIGCSIFFDWGSGEPSWANNAPMPEFPWHEDAFDGTEPVQSVHAAFGDVVRSILSVGAYQALCLERGDRQALVTSYVSVPGLPDPILSPELRSINREDLTDPITQDHWAEVWWDCHTNNDELEGAQRRLPGVASHLVRLAQTGILKTFARPFGGGESTELPPQLWEVDSGLPRLASCAINLDLPFDPAAENTHWLFVDGADLNRELGEPIDNSPVPDSAAVSRPSAGYVQNTIAECTEWLVGRFGDPLTSSTKKEVFAEEAIAIHGSRLSYRGFIEAWKIAARDFPERSRAGRRKSN